MSDQIEKNEKNEIIIEEEIEEQLQGNEEEKSMKEKKEIKNANTLISHQNEEQIQDKFNNIKIGEIIEQKLSSSNSEITNSSSSIRKSA